MFVSVIKDSAFGLNRFVRQRSNRNEQVGCCEEGGGPVSLLSRPLSINSRQSEYSQNHREQVFGRVRKGENGRERERER